MESEKLEFEKYHPQSQPSSLPVISFNTHYITFSKSCSPMLQRKPFCELYYDRRQGVIAIKPLQVESLYSLKICQSNGKRAISCRGFMSKFLLGKLGIGSEYKRFVGTWDDKNKYFLVNLKEEV